MKARVWIAILIFLLSCGFFFGAGIGAGGEHTAEVYFVESSENEEGEDHETLESLDLVFGAGPAAERLRDDGGDAGRPA